MSSRFLAVAAAAALAASVPAAGAEECGCPDGQKTHAISALPSYTAVFAGRVMGIQDEGEGRKVTLQVFRAWKGPRGKTQEIVTSAGACGIAFEPGADYVVYATGRKDALRTDACAPTAPLAQSAKAVRQLDLHAGYGSNPLRVPAAGTAAEARKE